MWNFLSLVTYVIETTCIYAKMFQYFIEVISNVTKSELVKCATIFNLWMLLKCISKYVESVYDKKEYFANDQWVLIDFQQSKEYVQVEF